MCLKWNWTLIYYRGGVYLGEIPTCSYTAAGWGQQRCSCFHRCFQWSSSESHIWVSERRSRNMTAGWEWSSDDWINVNKVMSVFVLIYLTCEESLCSVQFIHKWFTRTKSGSWLHMYSDGTVMYVSNRSVPSIPSQLSQDSQSLTSWFKNY